jgi:hypothetical protein
MVGMYRTESLSSMAQDNFSVAGYSTAGGTEIGGGGSGKIKMYTSKFSYAQEVTKAFKTVMQYLEHDVTPDSVIMSAGILYKPKRADIKILHFPLIYEGMLSMKPKSDCVYDYMKKKIIDSSPHLELLEDDKNKKRKKSAGSIIGQKNRKNVKALKPVEQVGPAIKLPTIFELTTTGTPAKKQKPKATLLKV